MFGSLLSHKVDHCFGALATGDFFDPVYVLPIGLCEYTKKNCTQTRRVSLKLSNRL